MVARVTEHLRAEGTVTLGQVRDMFGTSRKYAQALLEHLDAKSGDAAGGRPAGLALVKDLHICYANVMPFLINLRVTSAEVRVSYSRVRKLPE